MARASKIKRTIKRSPLYDLMQTISSNKHGGNVKMDMWGTAIVVGIIIAGILLVRTFLTAQ